MGIFEYSTDLFKGSTIARMAQQFLILLESISTNPDEHLNTLEMVTKQEKENQRMRRKEHEASLFTQIKDIRPKSVHLQKDR